MAYAKNDFVPGDEIFFEDLMDNEQIGEFPSMWDLVAGTGEVVSINGKKAIIRNKTGLNLDIAPLMKDMKNYLPEKFTLEMDLWFPKKGGEGASFYRMYFHDVNGRRVMELVLSTNYDASDKQEQPDNDWIAYIPFYEWQAMQTLCGKLEQAKEEFQKAIDGMSSFEEK